MYVQTTEKRLVLRPHQQRVREWHHIRDPRKNDTVRPLETWSSTICITNQEPPEVLPSLHSCRSCGHRSLAYRLLFSGPWLLSVALVSCTQLFPKKDLDWVARPLLDTEHRDWAQWSHQFLKGGWTQLQIWIAEETTKLQTSGKVTNGRHYVTSCLMVTVWASCPQNTEKENLWASAHQWPLSLKNFPLSQFFGNWLESDSIERSLCKP